MFSLVSVVSTKVRGSIAMFRLCIFLVAVSHVLKKYEEEFFKVVDAKYNLLRLKRKMVIDGGLKTKMESTDDETAKEHLFEHLRFNANVVTLREYCRMIIETEGYPNMQKLGTQMLNELPPEGLFINESLYMWSHAPLPPIQSVWCNRLVVFSVCMCVILHVN